MIHRDIKPGNILVEEREDGTLKPYIIDFGLAREVEDEGQTQTGAVLGTPAYMPPEQAQGDVRCDGSSLGRVFARRDAVRRDRGAAAVRRGASVEALDERWRYEDAPALGKVKKGVPADLETIVMKCLEREPSRRYDSARALAEDLQRFSTASPIQAKRASFGYVVLKKARKHKLAHGALVVLALGCARWSRGRMGAGAAAGGGAGERFGAGARREREGDGALLARGVRVADSRRRA